MGENWSEYLLRRAKGERRKAKKRRPIIYLTYLRYRGRVSARSSTDKTLSPGPPSLLLPSLSLSLSLSHYLPLSPTLSSSPSISPTLPTPELQSRTASTLHQRRGLDQSIARIILPRTHTRASAIFVFEAIPRMVHGVRKRARPTQTPTRASLTKSHAKCSIARLAKYRHRRRCPRSIAQKSQHHAHPSAEAGGRKASSSAMILERQLYSSAPPPQTWMQDNPTLLVSWWCTGFALVIILLRLSGRYIRTERLFGEDKVMALSIIPLMMRMGLVHVILIWGTNNVITTGLTAQQIRHREIGSRLVLASRIMYAAL